MQIAITDMEQVGLAGRVLFIDGEAIVIDKPAGLPVDPPRVGGDSVAARLDELKFGFQRPPVPVHRLDRDTSGCLLLARNPKALKRFGLAFDTPIPSPRLKPLLAEGRRALLADTRLPAYA